MADIGGMYMLDEEGQMVNRVVNAKLVKGKPSAREAAYSWNSTEEVEGGVGFGEGDALANDLGFAQNKKDEAGEEDAN